MDFRNFYKIECESFIASYELLETEGRLDLLSVRLTMMNELKKRALKEGLTEELSEAMLVTSTYEDVMYN